MRLLRKFLIWFFGILLVANLLVLVTGNSHLYRGLKNTYLVGRTGPEIDDMNAFPFEAVEIADPQSWPEAKGYGKVEITAAEEQLLDSIRTVAFTVIKDGELLYEHYYRGWDADSVFNSFSVSKSVVSTLIGIAMDKGFIESVFDPVSKYLPEYAEGRKAELRLWHLLTMSTGLNYDESGANPIASNAKAYYGSNLKKLMSDHEVVDPVGEQFNYVSGSTAIAAWVLEAATDQPLNRLAEEWLWKPLGAEETAYWGKDNENGTFRAFCCFNATARDFARIGQLYLDSGRWKGQQIIPEEFVEASLTPADLMDIKVGHENERYGYFWWMHPDTDTGPFFFARGYKGQYIIVVPKERLVIVRAGYMDYPMDDRGYHQDMFVYLDIARRLVEQAS
jgi:CubicO group peptidase (beta-lactamase class C family)